MRPLFPLVGVLVLGSCLAGAACSAGGGIGNNPNASDDAGDAGADGLAIDEGGLLTDGGAGDAEPPTKVVFYAHNNKTLFQVDSTDPLLAVTKVGDFDCIGNGAGQAPSMTDIAVDRDGKLYGVAQEYVFLDMQISGSTVQCQGKGVALSSKGAFFGGSFAPVGTLDPQKETLILADSAGDLYVVDTTNGQYTKVGSLGKVPANDGNGHKFTYPNTTWQLSGDIVFFENKGAPVGFATVRDCASIGGTCNDQDTVLELDPTRLSTTSPTVVTRAVRGMATQTATCNDPQNGGYGSIYGVAALGTSLIGFARSRTSGPTNLGLVIKLDTNKGAGCLVSDQTAAVGTAGWAGAGVTTSAPIVVPPPK